MSVKPALAGSRVVITGAARDFGRTLAIQFARQGAEVLLSARTLEAAEAVAEEIRALGHDRVRAYRCDTGDPASVRAFAGELRAHTDRVDVLVNNAARYLAGEDLLSVGDEDVVDTINSGATGTVLMVKNLLPLLRNSPRPDIVNMVSVCGVPQNHRSEGHDAYYAAKSAQAGFSEVLSKRLRPEGVRVISLYPPDFVNHDPLSERWESADRTADAMLTSQSVAECVLFAVNQPRDCFIRSFHFEQV
ncbi:SDR family oxidoreductase [Streptomyces alkaliterrae]|uniref:SDR family NAD(P)-dependent oxidoreductase n=1 Tax=Streptomyces alkaliterrae TaxID=2213162 RepID=A0A5P0YYB3_9ACTN|nr:SDR family oxidoreductase [Streptomyces alkaliterrae]MBB1262177.1 SDR family oxidoreductase [Streptomyces alkaliterrae]MQS05278.1 SDR family NAD(P)-dependent oxidoreductase [Streptomyces alkaliterrae]